MSDLWERLDDESAEAFAAFKFYRDTPDKDRSIVKCVESYWPGGNNSAKVRQWEKWSSKHRWQDRIRAWQMEKDRQARAVELEADKKAKEQHLLMLGAARSKAVQALAKMNPDDLKPGEILDYIINIIKWERIVRGFEDPVLAITPEQLSRLSDDKLRRLANGEDLIEVLTDPDSGSIDA